jgi:hypothetical protein
MKLTVFVIVLLSAGLAFSVACGGGEEKQSATPSPTISASPAPTTPAGTPTATGQLTLDIASVSPSTVHVGDRVTVTFSTRAHAVIGLQVVDGAGDTVAQDMVTVGSDGKAPYDFVAQGSPGSWLISAAAGATIEDLLRLQASPVPGPNTVDRTIEVQ